MVRLNRRLLLEAYPRALSTAHWRQEAAAGLLVLNLASQLTAVGLGAFMDVGLPGQSILDLPVSQAVRIADCEGLGEAIGMILKLRSIL